MFGRSGVVLMALQTIEARIIRGHVHHPEHVVYSINASQDVYYGDSRLVQSLVLHFKSTDETNNNSNFKL